MTEKVGVGNRSHRSPYPAVLLRCDAGHYEATISYSPEANNTCSHPTETDPVCAQKLRLVKTVTIRPGEKA